MVMEDKGFDKMIGNIISGFISNKPKDFSINLDGLEVSLPFLKEPIKLSGKVTITMSNEKKK